MHNLNKKLYGVVLFWAYKKEKIEETLPQFIPPLLLYFT
ncbi:hypothetical protein TSIB_1566 [Thermococcus sibiricus MM 739]|uniref:Uncharacterized protein n=1 Tax=Thermococcus sibiricus (strain DSM 12597 / MM 739) TaxID=604354 RepID=C6A4S2_THESM|nr:hypothetical protein TSIB_1566 [Thermococcus sibiricus MM 739]